MSRASVSRAGVRCKGQRYSIYCMSGGMRERWHVHQAYAGWQAECQQRRGRRQGEAHALRLRQAAAAVVHIAG